MRYALVAALAMALMPTVAEAGSKVGFFFGFGGFGYYRPYYSYYKPYYGYYYPPVYYPAYPYYRPYYGGYHRGYYGGFRGRYAVPRVYSPYRYGNYRSDYWRDYAYRRDFDYRRDMHRYDDRGYLRGRAPYYGPALERYDRDARRYPSYHYDRREGYNRSGGR